MQISPTVASFASYLSHIGLRTHQSRLQPPCSSHHKRRLCPKLSFQSPFNADPRIEICPGIKRQIAAHGYKCIKCQYKRTKELDEEIRLPTPVPHSGCSGGFTWPYLQPKFRAIYRGSCLGGSDD